MLQLSETLLGRPVLSLQTGGVLATTISPIFNPDNLKIEGFYCQDEFSKDRLILLAQEIRDFVPQGFVVNDHDALSEPEDLVRLQEILKINFELIGKPVVTVSKEKVGKVTDFAIDNQSLYVQKLYISQSLLKSLSNGQLSIDRSNIVEITNKKIVIQEILKPTKTGLPVTSPILG